MGIDQKNLSKTTRRHFAKEARKRKIRRIRQGSLFVVLLGVIFWAVLTHRADNHTFAWDRPVTVAFIALLDQGQGESDASDARFVDRFLSRAAAPRDNLRAVEEWMQREYTRHTGLPSPAFEFAVRGPVRLETAPPPIPDGHEGFWNRWGKTRAFMNYFEDLRAREDLMLGSYDVTVFIYFYDFYDKSRSAMFGHLESIANRRSRTGVVFAPISMDLRGNTCAVIAHELCHTLGASDKYDGNQSVHPEGFYEPNRQPLYPQEFAEIMALGIPRQPGKDELITDLDQCRVNEITASEMNWMPSAP